MGTRFTCPSELAGLVLALALGCGEVSPLGGRPKSDQFLTQEQFAAMVVPGTSRDAIRTKFGEPYAVGRGGSALAFLRRETADRQILTMAVVVPFWSKRGITYFQILGVWFDADGKVLQARLWNGHDGPHGGNPYEPYSVPSQEQTTRWLESMKPKD
jgi:hypothetical protein